MDAARRLSVMRGLVYFALVFAAGFALGTLRVLWLVPALGERTAELLEMPLMLVAITFAARFVVRRFPGPPAALLRAGALALALMLIAEFAVVLRLRGQSFPEYLESRDPIAGAAYLAMLVVFGLMPWLLGRRRGARPASPTDTGHRGDRPMSPG